MKGMLKKRRDNEKSEKNLRGGEEKLLLAVNL